MRRASSHSAGRKSKLSGSFARLFAANPALVIGIAFEAGMLLGRYTKMPAGGKKMRNGMSNLTGQALTLVPSSVTKLVPDIFSSKSRKPSGRKTSGRKRRTRTEA